MKLCLVFLHLLSIGWSQSLFANHELPCNYLDSIDISDGVVQANLSIIYGDIEFKVNNYGVINYILNDDMEFIAVKPYFRGCPCQIKPCIRLCCPHGSFFHTFEYNADQKQPNMICRNHSAANNFMVEILHENNETETLNLDQNFTYVNRICKSHYYARKFNITKVMN